MDKKIIFAVAGSGKTTHIIKGLSADKRSLIVTYTNSNYDNLRIKISDKFNGEWPENVTLMTYFSFLYKFCYKPFLADTVKARGILYDQKILTDEQKTKRKHGATQKKPEYYMTTNRYLYSNRLALLLEKQNVIKDVKSRIITYFDEFVIDEVQDISGEDFGLLEHLMLTDINMLFVGDFYQHTYKTSVNGNTNKNLFDDKTKYESRFTSKGFLLDTTTLTNSWRCSRNVCDYVRNNLGIAIYSHRPGIENTSIEYVTETKRIDAILADSRIVKLHYDKSSKFGAGHKNWGDTKGEDHYHDVCVILNEIATSKRNSGKLQDLAPLTKNKLYVAITRARNNVYLVDA